MSAKDTDPEPWMYDTFGCMDDFRLCMYTFLMPCYTIGRNAEHFGEDGVKVGVWYALCCCGIGPVLRWRLRQEQKLMGNMVADAVIHMLCPCCALIQENKQIYGLKGSHAGEKMPINQKVERE